ncbi:MAG: hypothetical protein ACE5FQ_02415, partial [Thiogranum sp.]
VDTMKRLTGLVTMLTLTAALNTPAAEQMELEGMAVIGNRELPKALFIVPWKDPNAELTPERPVNSLIDETLQPVDPDVFRRKLDYYDTVHKSD